jgi:hypothetical protein
MLDKDPLRMMGNVSEGLFIWEISYLLFEVPITFEISKLDFFPANIEQFEITTRFYALDAVGCIWARKMSHAEGEGRNNGQLCHSRSTPATFVVSYAKIR